MNISQEFLSQLYNVYNLCAECQMHVELTNIHMLRAPKKHMLYRLYISLTKFRL